MKRLLLSAGAALGSIFLASNPVMAQGTAFTYQGQLDNNGLPANGSYDLTFTLCDTNSGGGAVDGPITNLGTAVSNGLFSVTLDYGSGVFNGVSYWLEIGVRTNGATNFATLAPRQRVTPSPYAIYAPNAGAASTAASANSVSATNITGSIPLAQLPGTVLTNTESGVTLSGMFNGDGGGLTNLTVSAAQLASAGNANGGSQNFFVGPSGNSTTSGSGNTANGNQALYNNASGNGNTASGVTALYENTSGSDNTADGGAALFWNMTGSYNTAGGFFALEYNMTGSYNMADGFGALQNNTTGSFNTSVGVDTLTNFSFTGSNNIALGYLAGANLTTGSSNIDIGNEGLSSDTNIIRIGGSQSQTYIAGQINGNGGGLTGLNVNAGQLSSVGNGNVGQDNFFVGPSGNSANEGRQNTAIGVQALQDNTGGNYNTADGFEALNSNLSGNGNTADGSYALSANMTGNNNTADGFFALGYNSNGSNNVAVGVNSLLASSTGNNNIAIGYMAGANIGVGVESESFSANDNIDIGNPGTFTDSNTIRIGSSQTQTFISGIAVTSFGAGAPVYVNDYGQLGILSSSERFKQDVHSMGEASDLLLALRPVTFRYKPELDPKGTPQFGLIAEEVNKLNPDLVLRDTNNQILTVRYEAINAMLLNEFLKQHGNVQAQSQELQSQAAEIQELKAQNDALAKRLNALAQAVQALSQKK